MSKPIARIHSARRHSTKIHPRLTRLPSISKGVSSNRFQNQPGFPITDKQDSALTVGTGRREVLFVRSREGERNGVVKHQQKTRKQITMESARKEKSDSNTKGGPHVIEVDDEDDLKLPHRVPYDNLLVSIFVFVACFGWPVGIILSCISRRANQKENYDRSDCYGRIALYTDLMIIGLGIFAYALLYLFYIRGAFD